LQTTGKHREKNGIPYKQN